MTVPTALIFIFIMWLHGVKMKLLTYCFIFWIIIAVELSILFFIVVINHPALSRINHMPLYSMERTKLFCVCIVSPGVQRHMAVLKLWALVGIEKIKKTNIYILDDTGIIWLYEIIYVWMHELIQILYIFVWYCTSYQIFQEAFWVCKILSIWKIKPIRPKHKL